MPRAAAGRPALACQHDKIGAGSAHLAVEAVVGNDERSSRRKQLGNLLPRLATPSRGAEALARDAGWPEDWATLRPEALPPEAFYALTRSLE